MKNCTQFVIIIADITKTQKFSRSVLGIVRKSFAFWTYIRYEIDERKEF
jgi:hypothetical protein